MQINLQNIQRPKLFQDFFTLELIWNSEYLTYIQTTVKNITNIIKKSLNNYRHRYIDNCLVKKCPIFKSNSSSKYVVVGKEDKSFLFIVPDVEQHRQYYKDYEDFTIFTHSRNG